MALIWGGKQIACEAHVIDWRSSGLQFKPGKNNCGKRKLPPELLVVHFTGTENPPPAMFQNMTVTSVEFGMDYHGQIWQFCDPVDVICAQAQGANAFSFGIEIQNRGVPTTNAAVNHLFPREKYSVKMPWGEQWYTQFTAEQVFALMQFIDALTAAKIIPAQIPVDTFLTKRVPKKQWSKLRGVVGHYHVDVDPGKIDPGPAIFYELWDHFNPSPP